MSKIKIKYECEQCPEKDAFVIEHEGKYIKLDDYVCAEHGLKLRSMIIDEKLNIRRA